MYIKCSARFPATGKQAVVIFQLRSIFLFPVPHLQALKPPSLSSQIQISNSYFTAP